MSDATASAEGDESDDASYMRWKGNAMYLYDALLHHNLEWASMSCCWGPTLRGENPYSQRQVLFFSSRTDAEFSAAKNRWEGQPSMLIVAEVELPRPHTTSRRSIGRFKEIQRCSRVSVKRSFVHPGEVNRVRSLPAHPHLAATHSDSPNVYIWDTARQPNREKENKPGSRLHPNIADLVLTGHTDVAEYALDVSPGVPHVVSGGADCKVLIWALGDSTTDLAVGSRRQGSHGRATSVAPRSELNGHTAGVEDCAFNRDSGGTVCCSVGDDRLLAIWDTRSGTNPVASVREAHRDDINCCSWNDAGQILTGSSDHVIKLFDSRKLSKSSALKFECHTSPVLNVQWSPHDNRFFASTAEDGMVTVWDATKGGKPSGTGAAASASADDAIPEAIVFKHAGHRATVKDVQWNPASPWAFASVSDDGSVEGLGGGGTLQIWRVSELVYQDSFDPQSDYSAPAAR